MTRDQIVECCRQGRERASRPSYRFQVYASRHEAILNRPEALTAEEFAAYNFVNGLDK